LGIGDANAKAPQIRGLDFARLDATQQDQFLESMEKGVIEYPTVPAAWLFTQLLETTKEGYFFDPIHAGNRGMVAWRWIRPFSAIRDRPLCGQTKLNQVYPPRRADAARMSIPAFLELRNVPHNPSQNSRVRDFNTPLRHHRHEISIAQPLGDIPADANLNDAGVE
jgi:Gluconate 2-dehydrogenase subunit 3